MAKQSLLIADADPRSLRILEVALRKAGFSVSTATDGAEGLRRVQRTPPDLALCEIQLPGQDGISLCRTVRGDARLAGLPFLLMSSDKNPAVRVRALEAGADDFLVKPILLKELVGRVRLLLARREQQRFAQRGNAALTGALSDLGLVDLFQSLENWRKSARVVCESLGRSASVWVKDGAVIDAEVGPIVGAIAFYRLLNWDHGTFRVEFGAVDHESRIDGGTQGLLLEGMRRLDEIGRMQETLPDRSQRFTVDFLLLTQKLADMPDEVNGVLRLFDGRRTLDDVLEQAPIDDLSALAVMQRLINDKILKPQLGPAPESKPSLQQWLGDVSIPPPPDEVEPASTPTWVPRLSPSGAGAVEAAAQVPPQVAAPAPAALAAVASATAPAIGDATPSTMTAAALPALALAPPPPAAPAPAPATSDNPDDSGETAMVAAPTPPPSAPVLDVVRFPPARGVRRERLRREAAAARTAIAEGRPVRLVNAVELGAWPAEAAAPADLLPAPEPVVSAPAPRAEPEPPALPSSTVTDPAPIAAPAALRTPPPVARAEPAPPSGALPLPTPVNGAGAGDPALQRLGALPVARRASRAQPHDVGAIAPDEDEFDKQLRQRLRPSRSWRGPAIGVAAAAVVAAAVLLLRQPATDKKDAPWLQEKPPAASADRPPSEAPAAPPPAAEGLAAARPPEAAAPSVAPPPAPALVPQAQAPAPSAAFPSVPAAAATLTAPAEDDYARSLAAGEGLLKKGKYRAAVDELRKAVKARPDAVPALLALGDAFLQADRPKSALTPLERVVQLDAKNSRGQLLVGTAYQSLSRVGDARKAYERYLELEPRGEFAHDVRSILSQMH